MSVKFGSNSLWGSVLLGLAIFGLSLVGHDAKTPAGTGMIVQARPATGESSCQACHSNSLHPAPTEVVAHMGECEGQREAREEWINSLHKCPPELDWRQIEAANRRALSLERFANQQLGHRTDQWDEIGSANQAGRTHSAYPSTSGDDLYVGSNLGGVWRGTHDGTHWEALSDGLGLGSHELVIVPPGEGPNEPETIITATARTIFASYDHGVTWQVPEGFGYDNIEESIRILHDPSNPRTVYYITKGTHYYSGGGSVLGNIVYRSVDGGQSFVSCHQASPPYACDAWIDRVSGGDLYLLHGGRLYFSRNQGDNFLTAGTLPDGRPTEAVLAGSEDGAPTFYGAFRYSGVWKLYRSIDGGASWTYRYEINDFWKTLCASITNRNLVFFAGVECYRSQDGGGSFSKINNWGEYYDDPENKLHADFPGIDVHLVNGSEKIYFNTDGGTYISHDGGLSVQNLSLYGLGISQYYGIFTSRNHPYLIGAGAQDQGFQQSVVLSKQRDEYLEFNQIISGDYAHLTSSERNHDWLYSVYPGFILMQRYEDAPEDLYFIDFPETDHSWLPFILADPHDPEILYFCGEHIWKYERYGSGYSYSLSEMPQDFGIGFLTALGISPVDDDNWYAATNNGNCWYSHDGGVTWHQSGHGPLAHYFHGTAIAVSPTDRNVAYLGGSGYAGHAVWSTSNGGSTWEAMGDGLPSTTVLGLTIDGDSGIPYAATDAGPYGYNFDTSRWESLVGTEAPLTTYWCVEWVPEIDVIRFGTYGRGIWDYSPLATQGVAEEGVSQLNNQILSMQIAPNPATVNLAVRFNLHSEDETSLELFDVSGRCLVKTAGGKISAGNHEISIDLSDRHLEPGFYFARLTSGDGALVRKVQVVR
jgi:Secretion system C-terminal sorting domain